LDNVVSFRIDTTEDNKGKKHKVSVFDENGGKRIIGILNDELKAAFDQAEEFHVVREEKYENGLSDILSKEIFYTRK
jgi:hypothetical protein